MPNQAAGGATTGQVWTCTGPVAARQLTSDSERYIAEVIEQNLSQHLNLGQLQPLAPPTGGNSATIALAAGSNAGGSPPAPVLTAGSSDNRGNLTFGTGTTPAAGNMAVCTFANPFGSAPIVTVSAANASAAGLGNVYVTSISATGFTVACTTAPAGSQANTTYSVNWVALG